MPNLPNLRERFGAALQRRRQAQGLSQFQLANLVGLSLKYIGEIERGQANPSMDVIERIATALEWDPFQVPLREQDTLPEGVRTLLLSELTHMQNLIQTAIGWVQTLDAAMVRRGPEPPPELPPRVRVGRPRKPKTPSPEPSATSEVAPSEQAR
jgi:transcriptional regulator with XRE-family HTH domain